MPMKGISMLSLRFEGRECSKSSTSFDEGLQNVDFGHYIQTTCNMFGCPLVVNVSSMILQQNNLKVTKLKPAPKYKRKKSIKPPPEVPSPDSSLEFKLASENTFHITAVYDSSYELVEILMSKYPYAPIPRVLMQVIALKVPFLSNLTKFTIKQCCIDMYTIYELNKILAISNITDICLDHSPLKEANYDILLSDQSSLQSLSLSRCNINDIVCERIASRLHHLEPAEPNLLVLNLSSNFITDVGLKHLGEAFRSNRHLRYLNLADNHIGDDGTKYIFDVLAEFPLNIDEIEDKNRCYMHYLQNKEVLYRKYMLNLVNNAKKSNRRSISVRVRAKGKPNMKKNTFADEYLTTKARAMALEAVGPFRHPFSPSMVIVKGEQSHCIGNFTLCYLNLRYNNLTYLSVLRLAAVVRHQKTYRNERLCGLLNVLLEGNYVPENADEYEMINKDGIGIGSQPSKQKDKIKPASKLLVRRLTCSVRYRVDYIRSSTFLRCGAKNTVLSAGTIFGLSMNMNEMVSFLGLLR